MMKTLSQRLAHRIFAHAAAARLARLSASIAVVMLLIGRASPWAFGSTAQPAAEPKPAPAMEPERYQATLMLLNAPGGMRSMPVSIIVKRWSTDAEKQHLIEALKNGGQDALMDAMSKMDVATVSIGGRLGNSVAFATFMDLPGGRKVRLATNRPITFAEARRGTRSMDYPLGALEFTLDEKGRGEGILIEAAKIELSPEGEITVTTLPTNIAPQRLVGVKRWAPKKKKTKDESAEPSAAPSAVRVSGQPGP